MKVIAQRGENRKPGKQYLKEDHKTLCSSDCCQFFLKKYKNGPICYSCDRVKVKMNAFIRNKQTPTPAHDLLSDLQLCFEQNKIQKDDFLFNTSKMFALTFFMRDIQPNFDGVMNRQSRMAQYSEWPALR
jgi:hypothetical protein